MSQIKIVKKIPEGSNNELLNRYIREKDVLEREKNIAYLINLIRENPNITEDMVRVDLRKYLGIAKREYIKQVNTNNAKRR